MFICLPIFLLPTYLFLGNSILTCLFSPVGDMTPIYRWAQASSLYCSEINNDSSLLAVGLTSGCVALWNLVTCEL